MNDLLIYEEIVDDFENRLLTQLRQHSAIADFLEMWVPDTDPVQSITNMIEAAEIYGSESFDLQIGRSSISVKQLDTLKVELAAKTSISITERSDGYLLGIDLRPSGEVESIDELGLLSTLRGALSEVTSITHEGGSQVSNNTVSCEANVKGISLAVEFARIEGTDTISRARHRGATSLDQRRFLELFCSHLEGLPLAEARDHGAQHVLHFLCGSNASQLVPGLLMPRNAGAWFVLAETLIREISGKQMIASVMKDEPSEWTPPIEGGWTAKSPEEQCADIQPLLCEALAESGFPRCSVKLLTVEKDVKVIVSMSPEVDFVSRPAKLLHTERLLRSKTGRLLEVFVETMRDKSVLRFLTEEEKDDG